MRETVGYKGGCNRSWVVEGGREKGGDMGHLPFVCSPVAIAMSLPIHV